MALLLSGQGMSDERKYEHIRTIAIHVGEKSSRVVIASMFMAGLALGVAGTLLWVF